VYRCHFHLQTLWQVDKRIFFFFNPSYLLILTDAVEVILGMWNVWREDLCLSSNRAKLRILHHTQFLGKICGIQKNCWFWTVIIFRSKLGLHAHSWFYMYYSSGVRNICCSCSPSFLVQMFLRIAGVKLQTIHGMHCKLIYQRAFRTTGDR